MARKSNAVCMFAGAAALATTILTGAADMAAAQDAKRSIEQVKGDVYRFQNNFHYAMFVVTDDGIVVTDPINADAVNWLKGELATRFNKPVTHMVMSHFHSDHNSGGEAWGDGLKVIAHEQTKWHIEVGHTKTAMPTETFADKMAFEVGGKTIELTFLGEGHSDDLIAMVVRPENVAFIVDAVSPGRLPFRNFPRTNINGLIEQIKVVETLDFDVLLPGHSRLGVRQDATDMRLYIEKLKEAVTAELKAGKSDDEIVASVKMDDYQGWLAYEQYLEPNVRGMTEWLKASGTL